jgi:acyl-CoA synthetase (AMP-forming)/AMP-acid ligase II
MQSYGSTEGGMISVLSLDNHVRAMASAGADRLPLSCGRPLPGVELNLDARLGSAGAVGEDRNAAAGGWLGTSDFGCIDGEGYPYITDRKTEVVISGGRNIFPFKLGVR